VDSALPLALVWPRRARPHRISILWAKRSPGVASTRTRASRSLAFHQSCHPPGSTTAVSPSRRILVSPSRLDGQLTLKDGEALDHRRVAVLANNNVEIAP
jgi:hypothetical protein